VNRSRWSGTARLEEAVAACRAALQERTRERVPLDWAMTQNNLGTALRTLGARESGTARLEEAVAAYRAALQEYTASARRSTGPRPRAISTPPKSCLVERGGARTDNNYYILGRSPAACADGSIRVLHGDQRHQDDQRPAGSQAARQRERDVG
jgi:hypothetical protein